MNNYNLLIDQKLISDGSAVTSANGLQSGFFDVTTGENTVTITELIGATIVGLFRGAVPFEQVEGTPGTDEYNFNDTTGFLKFEDSLTFNPNEKLFIQYTTTGGATSTEPLTVQEVKDYLRLEGFIDDYDSPLSDFDDDDTLIGELITSARERLEAYTGLSFIPKTYEIEICNLAGNFRLPYGPVTEITSVEDTDGNTRTYTTTKNLSKLKTPIHEDLVVTYECGYSVLPKGLKEAMLKEIAFRYTNRGDIATELSHAAVQLATPYKEVDWLG